MKIKIDKIVDSPPYEKAIYIEDTSGQTHEFLVHPISIIQNTVEIGYPVGQRIIDGKQEFLVELPRESSQGLWRIWVHEILDFDGLYYIQTYN